MKRKFGFKAGLVYLGALLVGLSLCLVLCIRRQEIHGKGVVTRMQDSPVAYWGLIALTAGAIVFGVYGIYRVWKQGDKWWS
jgi:hypothetical protein